MVWEALLDNHKQVSWDLNNPNSKVAYLELEEILELKEDYLVSLNNHNNSKECLEHLKLHNNNKEAYLDKLPKLRKHLEQDFLVKHLNNHNNSKGMDSDNKLNNQQHQDLEVALYLDSLNNNNHNNNSKQDLDLEVVKWDKQL